MKTTLQDWWWQRRPTPWWATLVLAPLAGLYAGLTCLRRLAYRRGWLRQHRSPCATLVVGNRIVGGAGKTPVTLALVHGLQARGWRVGLVSRGHGRRQPGCLPVTPQSSATDVGDEPVLLARRTACPMWVAERRMDAVKALLAAAPDCTLIVCDDGLQHLALARDVEVVVQDERAAGNGHLLPWGPLREGLDTPSLAHAQFTVAQRGSLPSRPTPLPTGHAPEATPPWPADRRLGPVHALQDWWQGALPATALSWEACRSALAERTDPGAEPARPLAVAGIGDPARFVRDLRAHGIDALAADVPDHADYSQALPFAPHVRHVLVTEKDAVKLDPQRLARERPATQVWVVSLSLHLPTALLDALDQALRDARASRA